MRSAALGDDEGVDRDERQHREQRRQQATRAPRPERAQCDRARTGTFGQEQRRDQEAREHEERVDAEVTAPEVPGVEQQHARDRSPAQAVQGRLVLHATGPLHGRDPATMVAAM